MTDPIHPVLEEADTEDLETQFRAYRDSAEIDKARAFAEARGLLPEQMKVQGALEQSPEEKPAPEKTPAEFSALENLVLGNDPKPETTVIEDVISIAKDVGEGVVEAPRAIVGGLMDAFNSVLGLEADLRELGVPDIFFQITDEEGNLDPAILSQEETATKRFAGDLPHLALPTTDQPDSNTGQFVRSTSKFMAGFIGGIRAIKALKAAKGAKDISILESMGAGAIGDAIVMDPYEEKLAAYLNEVPSLRGPVMEWLSENDPEKSSRLEGRLKNSIEGVVGGAAVDGLMKVFRVYKSYRKARADAKKPDEIELEQARQEMKDAAKDVSEPIPDEALGDPGGPAVGKERPKPEPKETAGPDAGMETVSPQAQRAAERIARKKKRTEDLEDIPAAKPEGEGIFINHRQIQEPEDIQAALQGLADAEAKGINAKRGFPKGSKSVPRMLKESDKEFTDIVDLIGRNPGPMTAAEALAARKLLNASTEKVVALAKIANADNASKADLFNFRRAVQVHYAIQQEVIAARTETARALRSWGVPVGTDETRGLAINQLLESAGGADSIKKMAKGLAQLGDKPAGMNQAVRDIAQGRFSKAFYQIWINGLLSSPKTHLVNMTSNTFVSLWKIPEAGMEVFLNRTFGDSTLSYREVGDLAFGWVQGWRDAWTILAKGGGEGAEGVPGQLFENFGKVEGHVHKAISAEAFGLESSKWGHVIDKLGWLIDTPGTLLNKEDMIFKSLGYRMELNRQARRMVQAKGLTGDAANKMFADIISNPPPELRNMAIDAAHYQTFTKELGRTGQDFTRWINQMPGARFVLPFIRTPTNILKYTYERTPLAYISSSVRADVAAGGSRAAAAHAKVLMGSAVMMTMADYASQGYITGGGPQDPTLRKAWEADGWRPYSIKVGDSWVQYNRLDPIGSLIGLAADMSEIFTHVTNDERESVVLGLVYAAGNQLVNKTYLSGVTTFLAAIDPRNPFTTPEEFAQRFATSIIPFSSIVRQSAQAVDPTIRDKKAAVGDENLPKGIPDDIRVFMQGMINSFKANTPGFSKDLPPAHNIWGQALTRESGMGVAYDLISPIGVRPNLKDPVNKMIRENRIGLSMPQRIIDGVPLTAGEYQEYIRLAGVPAKAELDMLVKSNAFAGLSQGPGGETEQEVHEIINRHRKEARRTMIENFPDLARRIEEKQNADELKLLGIE